MAQLDYSKLQGLIPAIIQDANTKNVLMLGFMNEEAYLKTVDFLPWSYPQPTPYTYFPQVLTL